MARDHARLLVSIWGDSDFTALKSSSQLAYFALISSRDLSWCGVAPYLPRRLSGIASDFSERKAREGFAELEARRFAVVDRSTDELLVRSYVRHDGILKQPNVTKAMVKAIDRVHSTALVGVIYDELARLREAEPTLNGWNAMGLVYPEHLAEVDARVTGSASPKGSGMGEPKGSLKAC